MKKKNFKITILEEGRLNKDEIGHIYGGALPGCNPFKCDVYMDLCAYYTGCGNGDTYQYCPSEGGGAKKICGDYAKVLPCFDLKYCPSFFFKNHID